MAGRSLRGGLFSPGGIRGRLARVVGVSLAWLFTLGRCRDTDALADSLPAEWAAAEPARRKIQLRHVLSMSSGLEPFDGPYEPVPHRRSRFHAVTASTWALLFWHDVLFEPGARGEARTCFHGLCAPAPLHCATLFASTILPRNS